MEVCGICGEALEFGNTTLCIKCDSQKGPRVAGNLKSSEAALRVLAKIEETVLMADAGTIKLSRQEMIDALEEAWLQGYNRGSNDEFVRANTRCTDSNSVPDPANPASRSN